MNAPQTTTIALTDLVKLLDDIVETKRLATALKVELEELLENKFSLVQDLSVFDGAHEVLVEARKAGL